MSTNKITLLPSNIEFNASSEHSILSEALKSNVALNYSCSNGSCGACKSVVVSGEVERHDPFQLLTQNETSDGAILTCQSKCIGDVVLKAEYYPELSGITRKVSPAKINSISFPASDIAVIKFRTPPANKIEYLEGQYIDLVVGSLRRSYSIANICDNTGEIELHIRQVPGGQMSQKVFDEFKENTLVRLDGPIGAFFVKKSDRPLIFVCGGTGFAPVKAMVERLLLNGDERQVHVYWGAVNSSAFYSQVPNEWVQKHAHVLYTPVLSGEEPWQGRTGFVHKAILEDFESLVEFDVYACGSPVMIDAAKKDFQQRGLNLKNFHADAFVAS